MLRSRTDPQVFGILTERYGRKVYNFAVRFTQDKAAAEDLVQKTFLKAFEARSTYEPRGAFVAWLFTIARNAIYSRARALSRAPVVSIETRRGEAARSVPDPAAGPEQQAIQREDRLWIRLAMARLPESQREVLILTRYHAMSYQQVAEITGTSVEAVKQKVYRAVQTLRSWYEDEEKEERADDANV